MSVSPGTHHFPDWESLDKTQRFPVAHLTTLFSVLKAASPNRQEKPSFRGQFLKICLATSGFPYTPSCSSPPHSETDFSHWSQLMPALSNCMFGFLLSHIIL